MNLGIDNKRKTITAVALGSVAVLAIVYMVSTMSSSSPAPTPATATLAAVSGPPARRIVSGKKLARPDSLDPTLRLDLLTSSEQVHYAGSGRNIFMSQAEPEIPIALKSGAAEEAARAVYVPPTPPQAPPINLKFYGFANQPGEPKRVFLSQGEDQFIAGEGDIVNRRYKVVRISNSSVDVQDLLSSGPPQTIPLTQG